MKEGEARWEIITDTRQRLGQTGALARSPDANPGNLRSLPHRARPEIECLFVQLP
ncbi:hypothetical protein RRSWK_01353 [Rhodopirellula sp. SWK7]|nr:hypothetical protein RRSWK_01353 [Rhodopirellula sp. SWK7]